MREWAAGWQWDKPGVRVAWLSLDEGDNDSTRFLVYLVAAMQTIFSEADITEHPHIYCRGRDVRG